MFSLQRLLGKEDMFFDLLEASAQEAHNSVQTLIKLSAKLDQPASLEEFAVARRKDKQITKQITEAIYTTFVTALEREDIEALSNALYKIPKTIEKFGERALMASQHVHGVDFSPQIKMLDEATRTVLELVKSLHRGVNLEEIRALNAKLQQIEGEADNTIMSIYKDLFSGRHDPIKVIVLKDLYELLEKVVDRCRDAGNVISHIGLKNS
jgi:uncharacterized protein Yka (UPF0111/DUF47 family)